MPDLSLPPKFVQCVALYDHIAQQTIDFGDGRRLWSGGIWGALRALGVTDAYLTTPLRRLLERMGSVTVLHTLRGGRTVLELHQRPTWQAWIAAGGTLPQKREHRTPQSELHERALTKYVNRQQQPRDVVIATILAMSATERRETMPPVACVAFLRPVEHSCRVPGLDPTVPRTSYAKDSTCPVEYNEPDERGQVAVTVYRNAGPVTVEIPASLLDTAPPARSNREGTGQTLPPPKTPRNEPPLVTADGTPRERKVSA